MLSSKMETFSHKNYVYNQVRTLIRTKVTFLICMWRPGDWAAVQQGRQAASGHSRKYKMYFLPWWQHPRRIYGYIKKPAEILAIKVHLQHIFEVTFQVICLTLDHPSVQSLQVFASSDLQISRIRILKLNYNNTLQLHSTNNLNLFRKNSNSQSTFTGQGH